MRRQTQASGAPRPTLLTAGETKHAARQGKPPDAAPEMGGWEQGREGVTGRPSCTSLWRVLRELGLFSHEGWRMGVLSEWVFWSCCVSSLQRSKGYSLRVLGSYYSVVNVFSWGVTDGIVDWVSELFSESEGFVSHLYSLQRSKVYRY